MSVPNGEKLASKQDLADMYHGILPYLGGMPEMLANKFSKGDLYSTDEKMIGQWIDGKPIYQRVLDLGTLSLSSSTTHDDIDISTWDKETIVNCTGGGVVYKGSSLQGNVTFPQNYISDLGLKISIKVSTSGDLLVVYKTVGATGTFTIHDTFIIIQYTKTTDSAISIGNDADYSTEEKIVGSWIDGKPIYQKTVSDVAIDSVIATNVATFVNATQILRKNSSGSAYIVTDCGNTTNNSVIFSLSSGSLSILKGASGYAGGNVTCTFQYTKTS